MTTPLRSTALDYIFPGNSEMAHRMRELEWSKTPVGVPAKWSQNLRTAVSICVTSRFPMNVWWGKDLTLFYNDAYISFLGRTKHPVVLGKSGKEAWLEIWDTISPMISNVFATGTASWSEDILMLFDRELPEEEVYVTFSFSPIFGTDGAVEGMFCACTETTEKIIGNRRVETLRRLSVRASIAHDVREACNAAVEVLDGNSADIPFAGIYIVDKGGLTASRYASSGLSGPDMLPTSVSLTDADTSLYGAFAESFKNKHAVEVDELDFQKMRDGISHALFDRAIIVPIFGAYHDEITGLLIAGKSFRRPLDSSYRTFFELIAGQIGAAITDARAFEQERIRAEALAELDRSKTAFFANISHEFRTPLTLILAPLEDAVQTLSGESETKLGPLLRMMHRNALRLIKLVNTLLDFARIEAGRMQAQFDAVDLASLTSDLAGTFRSLIETAGLKLIVDCETLAAPVFVDRSMWEKVIFNLLSNAFKFTFQGEITVRLRQVDSFVELVVKDTGIGIPQQEIARVFERFHRIEGARGRSYEGTGIGLALVQELVKMHGGQISATSEPGRGTSFIVRIPASVGDLADRSMTPDALALTATNVQAYLEEAKHWLPDHLRTQVDADAAADALSDITTHRETILLAEDNADMRAYLVRLLSSHYHVVSAANGREALSHLAVNPPPDLILSDVMMPVLDGIGLLIAVRQNVAFSTIPFILLSARAGEESRVLGLQARADDYLVKPFTGRELVARVDAHLSLSRMRREFSSRLIRGQEEERRRVARELHDALGQQVAIAAFELDRLKGLAPEKRREFHSGVQRLSTYIADLAQGLRSVSHGLHSSVIEDFGLVAALEGLVNDYRCKEVEISLYVAKVPGELTNEIAITIFRVAQEAVRNAYKHAKGSIVEIRLSGKHETLTLTVEDTGPGFHLGEVQSRNAEGLGLISMRERAHVIGAALKIHSAVGIGTTISLSVPLRESGIR